MLSIKQRALVSLPSVLVMVSKLGSFADSPLKPLAITISPLDMAIAPTKVAVIFLPVQSVCYASL